MVDTETKSKGQLRDMFLTEIEVLIDERIMENDGLRDEVEGVSG